MKLGECEVLPGVVIDVEDPKHIGRVKAMVPTWFDSDVMQKEALPWIWPCSMCGYQRFSKLENGRKIWVLHNKENDLEYWYWPMFEEIAQSKPIIDQYDSTELLLCRGGGESGDVFIYYNDSEGIILKIGETKINISTNKEIHITDGTVSFDIEGSKINIGKGTGEKVIMGEKLQKALEQLAEGIEKVGKKMTAGQHTNECGEMFTQVGTKLKKACNSDKILSNTVFISK